LGLDFYRKVLALQQKHAGTMRVRNDFQTNGSCWTRRGASFFGKTGFTWA